MSSPSPRQASLRNAACVLSLALLLVSAVRFAIYDAALTEQFVRIAAGALR